MDYRVFEFCETGKVSITFMIYLTRILDRHLRNILIYLLTTLCHPEIVLESIHADFCYLWTMKQKSKAKNEHQWLWIADQVRNDKAFAVSYINYLIRY